MAGGSGIPPFRWVARAAGKFGADAKGAAPALKKLKLSPSLSIREAAAATLEKVGKDD